MSHTIGKTQTSQRRQEMKLSLSMVIRAESARTWIVDRVTVKYTFRCVECPVELMIWFTAVVCS
jgi:hypothetical protein